MTDHQQSERWHVCYCVASSNASAPDRRVWLHAMTFDDAVNYLEHLTRPGEMIWGVDFGECPSKDSCKSLRRANRSLGVFPMSSEPVNTCHQ